ncbi:egg cell-secreted protein 1.4-like [Punica granatum]|uniref:Egg cell-secreted protein 1.4-like n=1 Tax=Punica granatum TaxID=22663 RepID=A0A218Y3F3_PUNGR|nr:egg cell-secreted protein 1.4-like [Punica granatum]OWM91396.1 hypothetical protein CDL15_Pgr017314 [Punica granatum]
MPTLDRSIILLITLFTCLASCTGAIRVIEAPPLPVATSNPGHSLAQRLEAAAGGATLVDCWDALVELKSCSNEIILFFLNGETSLGAPCCAAVDIITRSCWPAMLTSLGFTPEEGNILRGYCDAKAAGPAPSPASSSSP